MISGVKAGAGAEKDVLSGIMGSTGTDANRVMMEGIEDGSDEDEEMDEDEVGSDDGG